MIKKFDLFLPFYQLSKHPYYPQPPQQQPLHIYHPHPASQPISYLPTALLLSTHMPTTTSPLPLRNSQHSTCSNPAQPTYQIEPFQIQQNSLTHQQVLKMIDKWDTFARIKEKFFIWEFNFEYDKILKIAPEEFYKAAIHYLFLKKMQMLVRDFDQARVMERSYELKEIYKVQALKGKLKGRRFDYLLLVTVKLIGFFLGSHTREIIINPELQAEIYAILVHVLLGAEVGERTFAVIMDKYKKKPILKYSRSSEIHKHSLIPIDLSKKPSDHKERIKQTSKSKKRIARQCRTGTALFHQLPEHYEDRAYMEMKELLKKNLVVKEFVPKPKPKETLNEVLDRAVKSDVKLQELREAKQMEKQEMKHKKLFYTQMSSSMDLSRQNESLNLLHNHSIAIKPEKQSKYYQIMKKSDLKLPLIHDQTSSQVKLPKIQKAKEVQVYSYQAMVQKKMQSGYWKKIIEQMKEENKYENVENFPPIGARMYFKHGELDDERKMRLSETVDSGQPKDEEQAHNDTTPTQEDHAQYLTQKVVDTPFTSKDITNLPTLTRFTKKPSQPKPHKKTSIGPSALQNLRDQINIIEYSTMTNEKQIFKEQKGFMNVYSNQPIEDGPLKLKKKPYMQLKDIERRFYKECEERREKVERCYFC